MTGLVARLRPRRRPSTPRTHGELLARVGRALLWLVLVVVLIRGVAGTFATDRQAPSSPVTRAAAAPMWPDDAARALAVEFASAYLTHAPTDESGAYAATLEAFASPEWSPNSRRISTSTGRAKPSARQRWPASPGSITSTPW
jgi:hypothetical protein